MKGKLFYIVVSVVTVLLCFSGCTEGSSTESKSDKRALEDTDSSTAQTKVTTTLTPLQTFTRFTAFAEKSEESQTEKAMLVEKKETTALTESDRTDWFEKNKLFDMELSVDDSSVRDGQLFWKQEERTSPVMTENYIKEVEK